MNKCFNVFKGNYTSLRATFRFERRMGFYLIQVYLPSLIITILSWLSFYIDPRDIGERVSLGNMIILHLYFLKVIIRWQPAVKTKSLFKMYDYKNPFLLHSNGEVKAGTL